MGQCEFIHEKITSHGFQREIAQQIFLQIVENAGQQFAAASPVYVAVPLTQGLIILHHQMQNKAFDLSLIQNTLPAKRILQG